MSDLEKYIQEREKRDPYFRAGLEEERRNLRIGILIKELRIERGMTQEQLPRGDSYDQECSTSSCHNSRLHESHRNHCAVDSATSFGPASGLLRCARRGGQAPATSNAVTLRVSRLNSTPIRWIGLPPPRYLSA